MTILVLGDSTAFGYELSDLPKESIDVHGNGYYDNQHNYKTVQPSQLAWPALLGKHLNIDIENLSIVGGSNERMYRLAVEHTSKKSYSLVICAWTGLGRLDLQHNGIDIAVSSQCCFQFDWIKTYTAQHYDLLFDTKKWLVNLITLQSYFKHCGQPYLFLQSHGTTRGYRELTHLSRRIDTDNCMYWDTNMYARTEDHPRGPQGHMLEQSHQIVAQELGQLIKDRFLVRRADGCLVYSN